MSPLLKWCLHRWKRQSLHFDINPPGNVRKICSNHDNHAVQRTMKQLTPKRMLFKRCGGCIKNEQEACVAQKRLNIIKRGYGWCAQCRAERRKQGLRCFGWFTQEKEHLVKHVRIFTRRLCHKGCFSTANRPADGNHGWLLKKALQVCKFCFTPHKERRRGRKGRRALRCGRGSTLANTMREMYKIRRERVDQSPTGLLKDEEVLVQAQVQPMFQQNRAPSAFFQQKGGHVGINRLLEKPF